jgi:hypothetical protein
MTCTKFVIALVLFGLPAFAQRGESAKPAGDAGATAAAAKSWGGEIRRLQIWRSEIRGTMKNPLPADKSVPQTITVNGKTLHYTATVGTIMLKGKDDKPTGVVMYTAFTLDQPKGEQPKGDQARGDEAKGRNKDGDGGSHRPVTVRAEWRAGGLVRLFEPGRDRAEAYCLCE